MHGVPPGFSWIDLPIHGEHEPEHETGVVRSHRGLYFVGLHFLSAMSSEMIQGVGEDADRIAGLIHDRVAEHRTEQTPTGGRIGARHATAS